MIPEDTAVAAVGPSTAAAVVAAGLRVRCVPASGSGGAALAEAFGDGPGQVLIPGAVEPAPGLAEGLDRARLDGHGGRRLRHRADHFRSRRGEAQWVAGRL